MENTERKTISNNDCPWCAQNSDTPKPCQCPKPPTEESLYRAREATEFLGVSGGMIKFALADGGRVSIPVERVRLQWNEYQRQRERDWKARATTVETMTAALLECAVPLEVLCAWKRKSEHLAPGMNAQIEKAVVAIRAVLGTK